MADSLDTDDDNSHFTDMEVDLELSVFEMILLGAYRKVSDEILFMDATREDPVGEIARFLIQERGGSQIH